MSVCVCRLLWSDCVRGLSEATDIVGLDVLIVNGIYGRPWSGLEIMERFEDNGAIRRQSNSLGK